MDEKTFNKAIEKMVCADFDSFDFADKPMEKYCEYHRSKHVNMAIQMTINFVELGDYVSVTDVADFIHGLNHIFFNGVAAGQTFEATKKK